MSIKLNNRFCRISKILKKEISVILHTKIRDPRLNLVLSVSFIEVFKDLSYAKIFITFLYYKDKKKIKDKILILNNASSFIRYLLSKKLNLRTIPILKFFYDDAFFKSMKIFNIINKLQKNN